MAGSVALVLRGVANGGRFRAGRAVRGEANHRPENEHQLSGYGTERFQTVPFGVLRQTIGQEQGRKTVRAVVTRHQ